MLQLLKGLLGYSHLGRRKAMCLGRKLWSDGVYRMKNGLLGLRPMGIGRGVYGRNLLEKGTDV